MKNEIIAHQNDPRQLEKLYRRDKATFKRVFGTVYPELSNSPLADFWHERLHYESDEINWGTRGELLFVIVAALVAGFTAKLPTVFELNEEIFYTRNLGFIIFPAILGYFAWKHKLTTGKIALIAVLMLASLLFINFLPDVRRSDTLVLACVHLLLFLWSVLGFAFIGSVRNLPEKRLEFLKYNGDLVVMCALILISGALMTGITMGLFSITGFNIEQFYFENIVVSGLAAAPVVGTFLIRTNPALVGKVSPVIAKIFSPLVLAMLVIYLLAVAYSGNNPYTDRDFLIIFNGLLIGVMAIIFFSVAESSGASKSRAAVWVLFLLSVVTVLVNGIALSAILFRISEWGITPNRAAVLGSNILILINLLLVTRQLFRVVSERTEIYSVGKSIAFYLPVYCLWAVIITFIFPFLFGFK